MPNAFVNRTRQAAADGIVLAVKWGLVAIVFAGIVYAALGDYQIVRQNSLKGAAAFDYLDKTIKSQQSSATAVPAPAPGQK